MIGIQPKLGDLSLNDTQEIILLKRRLDELEGLLLRGKPIRPGSSTTVNTTTTGGSSLTPAQVLSIIVQAYIAEERISSTGTSHVFAHAPAIDADGNPLAFLVLNNVDMRRGATGNNGWSFVGPNAITTVFSLAASDVLVARYIKKTL